MCARKTRCPAGTVEMSMEVEVEEAVRAELVPGTLVWIQKRLRPAGAAAGAAGVPEHQICSERSGAVSCPRQHCWSLL